MMQIKNTQIRRGIYRGDGKLSKDGAAISFDSLSPHIPCDWHFFSRAGVYSHVYKVPPKEIDRYSPVSWFDGVIVVDSPERGGR